MKIANTERLAQRWAKLVAWLKTHVLKITAAILLLIAVILALLDRIAAGSLVAALFVVVALFHFLPQLESFAAFGIKAKWRKQLDEAEAILEKLKLSTIASAQLGYYLLGWGSRMGGERPGQKQEIADQIDKAIANLNLDPDTLSTLKRDYLFLARRDLLERFDAIARMNIEANKLSPRLGVSMMEEPWEIGLRALCHGRIPKELPSQDAVKLASFADRVADIDEECRKTGRVTDEATKLIHAFRKEDTLALYRALFGREPTS
jgi:hypothetical protein